MSEPLHKLTLEVHLTDDEYLAVVKEALAELDVKTTQPYTVRVWLLEALRRAIKLAVYRASKPETDEGDGYA